MADILEYTGTTLLDIPAKTILRYAREANLESAIVIGRKKDGSFYFAGTTSDLPLLAYEIERAKKIVMRLEDN